MGGAARRAAGRALRGARRRTHARRSRVLGRVLRALLVLHRRHLAIRVRAGGLRGPRRAPRRTTASTSCSKRDRSAIGAPSRDQPSPTTSPPSSHAPARFVDRYRSITAVCRANLEHFVDDRQDGGALGWRLQGRLVPDEPRRRRTWSSSPSTSTPTSRASSSSAPVTRWSVPSNSAITPSLQLVVMNPVYVPEITPDRRSTRRRRTDHLGQRPTRGRAGPRIAQRDRAIRPEVLAEASVPRRLSIIRCTW